MKISILLIVALSAPAFCAWSSSKTVISNTGTFVINVSQDSLVVDTTAQDIIAVNAHVDSLTVGNGVADSTLYRSIILYMDSSRCNLRRPYDKDAVKFRYDSFKEKIKEPWIGDILKDIFFR